MLELSDCDYPSGTVINVSVDVGTACEVMTQIINPKLDSPGLPHVVRGCKIGERKDETSVILNGAGATVFDYLKIVELP
jgi:hypothetical protein